MKKMIGLLAFLALVGFGTFAQDADDFGIDGVPLTQAEMDATSGGEVSDFYEAVRNQSMGKREANAVSSTYGAVSKTKSADLSKTYIKTNSNLPKALDTLDAMTADRPDRQVPLDTLLQYRGPFPLIGKVDTGSNWGNGLAGVPASIYDTAASVLNGASGALAGANQLLELGWDKTGKHVTGLGLGDSLMVASMAIPGGVDDAVVGVYRGTRAWLGSKAPSFYEQAGGAKPGTYRPTGELPKTDAGIPKPSSEYPHTQLGTQTSRKAGDYTQAREWGYGPSGKLEPKRVIDFTDHGRPTQHPNPHYHEYVPNPTGGTPQHGPATPF